MADAAVGVLIVAVGTHALFCRQRCACFYVLLVCRSSRKLVAIIFARLA